MDQLPQASQYQTYDVTSLLASGKNALGFQLGGGWYRATSPGRTAKNSFGNDIALLFQLDILMPTAAFGIIV